MRICTKKYTGTKGVYAHLIPDRPTVFTLESLVRRTNLPFVGHSSILNPHVSIICSDRIPNSLRIPFPSKPIDVKVLKAAVWTDEGKAVVLLEVESPKLNHLHSLFLQKGAVHTYSVFLPHLTLATFAECTSSIRNWLGIANEVIKQYRPKLVFDTLRIQDSVY